ncbi:MAG TPA: hypothetical protein VGI39_16865 [Polyangiaceae bacterium]
MTASRKRSGRLLSDAHVRRLHTIFGEHGSSVERTARALRSSPGTIEDAITRGLFLPKNADDLEARIDAFPATPNPKP